MRVITARFHEYPALENTPETERSVKSRAGQGNAFIKAATNTTSHRCRCPKRSRHFEIITRPSSSYKPRGAITFVREIARIKRACFVNEKRFCEWEVARVSASGKPSFYRPRGTNVASKMFLYTVCVCVCACARERARVCVRERCISSGSKNDTDHVHPRLLSPALSFKERRQRVARLRARNSSRLLSVFVACRAHFISIMRFDETISFTERYIPGWNINRVPRDHKFPAHPGKHLNPGQWNVVVSAGKGRRVERATARITWIHFDESCNVRPAVFANRPSVIQASERTSREENWSATTGSLVGLETIRKDRALIHLHTVGKLGYAISIPSRPGRDRVVVCATLYTRDTTSAAMAAVAASSTCINTSKDTATRQAD